MSPAEREDRATGMRYADLDVSVRTFLETLTPQHVEELIELSSIYRRIPGPVLDFLLRAQPETIKFLTDARPQEIAQLDEGIRLVGSMRTVGRFVRWGLLAIIGAFLGTVALGEGIAKVARWFRGGG